MVAMQKGYEMPKTPLRMETLESEDEAPPLPPRAPTSKKVSILHIPGPIACGCLSNLVFRWVEEEANLRVLARTRWELRR